VKKLESLIGSAPSAGKVAYLGPLFGSKRVAAFQGCDVFVCPSHTENFGVVVGEALACGKPVIATQSVPWPELQEYDCGWWVPDTHADLKEALLAAVQTSDQQLTDMGERGRKLIEAKFLWPSVARQMAETYTWLLGAGQRPAWVDVA